MLKTDKREYRAGNSSKGRLPEGPPGWSLEPKAQRVDGKPWLPKKRDYEADVVVVGTGYAGQNAAIAAHDAGALVLMLGNAPEEFSGGNSSVSGGGMRIPLDVPEAIDYYRALRFETVES